MNDLLTTQYLPIAIFIGVALLIGAALMVAPFLSPSEVPIPKRLRPTMPLNAFGGARMKFDLRYYLVSILFIIFDLEIAFLFPGRLRSRKSASFLSGR